MANKPFALRIPNKIADVIRTLHPDLKRLVRAAIDKIAFDPELGGELRDELAGCRKYRVKRFRLVYTLDKNKHTIHLIAAGHRRDIYEELTERLKRNSERTSR